MAIYSVNPASEEVIAEYEPMSDTEMDDRLNRAVAAFQHTRWTALGDRAKKMFRTADLLEGRMREFGELMTVEMGKPIKEAIAEVQKCAWGCRYYAEHAKDFLADEVVDTGADRSYVAFQPMGPVLAVMPWNFPFWQVFRFAAPAIMAGNVALLKHASNVTGCAYAIEGIFRDAGFVDDEVQTIVVESDRVAGLIADRRIAAATVTGSVGAGRSVGAESGRNIKPSVLELGGSDPFIVLADADVERAATLGVRSRMQNNSQSCIAAKRFIIEKPIAHDFTDAFVARMESLRMGDPLSEEIDVGPLAREDLRSEVHGQVERSIQQGAALLTGGRVPGGRGFFYPPTVLADVRPGMVPFEEEIFGPVASITIADDVDDAISLANRSNFGLGGAVFTADEGKGEEVALRLDVGCAFVNEIVKSDPRLPFGGVKESGYGRELSHFGIRAFVNVKTVWIDRQAPPLDGQESERIDRVVE